MILRLLTRRLGALAELNEVITPEVQAQIQQLSIAQLEDLGEALLDFSATTDLAAWLEAHKP